MDAKHKEVVPIPAVKQISKTTVNTCKKQKLSARPALFSGGLWCPEHGTFHLGKQQSWSSNVSDISEVLLAKTQEKRKIILKIPSELNSWSHSQFSKQIRLFI